MRLVEALSSPPPSRHKDIKQFGSFCHTTSREEGPSFMSRCHSLSSSLLTLPPGHPPSHTHEENEILLLPPMDDGDTHPFVPDPAKEMSSGLSFTRFPTTTATIPERQISPKSSSCTTHQGKFAKRRELSEGGKFGKIESFRATEVPPPFSWLSPFSAGRLCRYLLPALTSSPSGGRREQLSFSF